MKNTTTAALLGLTCAAAFTAGCSSTVATVQGPDHRQKLGTPQPIAVHLDAKRADPDTFTATLNGTDITSAFVFDEHAGQLADGFVYEPTPGRTPHQITVAADPALNAKGRPMGQPFEHTLTFFPPSISLQGNVGLGHTSRVDVQQSSRTSVMIKLPQTPTQETTLTVIPVATDAAVTGELSARDMIYSVALNDHQPGQPITLTVQPGQRIAVFTVRGQTPGLNTLRVEAPGYVAAAIEVFVDRPALTAAVNHQ